MIIPEWALSLLTIRGFVSRYFHHLKNCETNAEAYQKTDQEHMQYFKKKKYSSYESFNKVKNRYLKGVKK